MISFVCRGKGYLSPLLLVASILCMMPSNELGVQTCQWLTAFSMLASGCWVAWYGRKLLLAAEQRLERRLAPYEWVFDFAVFKPMPFHSFMFIQMPWWAAAHFAAGLAMVRLLIA